MAFESKVVALIRRAYGRSSCNAARRFGLAAEEMVALLSCVARANELADKPLERADVNPCLDVIDSRAGRSTPTRSAHRQR
jgi:hypothetical protein